MIGDRLENTGKTVIVIAIIVALLIGGGLVYLALNH